MMSLCLSPGVSRVEGLPGLHVDPRHAAEEQRRRPAGAPIHAAGRLTTLPCSSGGAVPQTHVTLLNTRDPSEEARPNPTLIPPKTSETQLGDSYCGSVAHQLISDWPDLLNSCWCYSGASVF